MLRALRAGLVAHERRRSGGVHPPVGRAGPWPHCHRAGCTVLRAVLPSAFRESRALRAILRALRVGPATLVSRGIARFAALLRLRVGALLAALARLPGFRALTPVPFRTGFAALPAFALPAACGLRIRVEFIGRQPPVVVSVALAQRIGGTVHFVRVDGPVAVCIEHCEERRTRPLHRARGRLAVALLRR